MSQTKDNIKKVSSTVLKVAKIAKVFTMIALVASLVSGIFFTVVLATDGVAKLVEDYPQIGERLRITEDHAFGLVKISSSLSDYSGEELIQVSIEHALESFGYAIMAVLILIVLNELVKTFQMIADNDSPFNEALLHRLKPIFILITVICAFESILLALVVGAVLMCLYEIFKYGCELQIESDETL